MDELKTELVRLEQAGGIQSLGFSASPVAWWEIVAGAQAALSAAHIHLREGDQMAEARSLLRLGSRMLDAASRPSSDLPHGERRYLAQLALHAFAMDANTPSAMAIAARFPDLLTDGTPNELAAAGTALPSKVGDVLAAIEDGPQKDYLEQLNYFLEAGEADQLEGLRAAIRTMIVEDSSSFESVLLASSLNTLGAISRHAVRLTLRETGGELVREYADRLIDEGVRTLLPPQRQAIQEAGLLAGDNAVLAMPTSTGKTLCAELALMAGLEEGPGLVCYVAPYVALGRQVASTMRRRARGLARVHPMIGGYRLPRPLSPTTEREIAVCTPERLDALLRIFPEVHEHIRTVVVDEAHLVGNGVRGARLEGIVSRLLVRQRAGTNSRIVLLSAVVPNPDDLAEWLGPDTAVATSDWRPGARRTVFWGESGQLQLLIGDDPIRGDGQSAASILGTQGLPWPKTNFYATTNIGQQLAQLPDAYENVGYMSRFLLTRDEGSVLVICASRKGTRSLARAVAAHLPELDQPPRRVAALIERIQSRYPYLRSLVTALLSGVAYHNAALPSDVRERIEDAVREGDLDIVVATTTLAEGVDLPFRFTVLAD